MVTLPFAIFPAISEEITLDGVPYRFSFMWNFRGSYWSFSILDRDRTQLIDGVKVVLDYEMLRQFPTRKLPPGELWAVDPAGILQDIGQGDLGKIVEMIYFSEAEVAAG